MLFVGIMDVVALAAMGNQSIGIIDNWIRHIKVFIVYIMTI
jgi:hypothetical protein